MDIVENCKKIIKERLEDLKSARDVENLEVGISMETESQSFTEAYFTDTDKNLDKILNQQAHLKRIIDQDNSIQLVKSQLTRLALEIEAFRNACTKQNEAALRERQELAQAQAKEIEKFQMNQIRSISEDFNRHQEILDQRKKEIQSLTKEIEREQKERGAYLADVEKKLERQLQERQKAIKGGALPFTSTFEGALSGGERNPDQIELTSVDEYAPYGTAPHSKLPNTTPRSSGTRGRGRGRRRRG